MSQEGKVKRIVLPKERKEEEGGLPDV